MKAKGIHSKVTKKYKATTNLNHNLPAADNILNREFSADKTKPKMGIRYNVYPYKRRMVLSCWCN